VDGRYAPSPTGSLHLGNLRTALLAWLFARSAGSRFLMRVDDLDRQRVRPGCEEEQLRDLAALGIDWDGPVVRQSERLALYEDALAALGERLYPCYCTRAEIREAASAAHGPPTEGFYPGTCRSLTPTERAEREAAGRRPALRLRAEGERVEFDDRLIGRCEGVVDDFVVRRNDGTPAYNLAVVVDDAEQGVREVVRGADLVYSTPRQILLARLLGVEVPAYAHVPLVLGADGARLAKRHGSVTLADRVALGATPGQVLSWLAATMALAAPGEEVAAADLVERFDPDRLPREPTTYAE
jgi:glutamyl-tRNA synthetase